MGKLNEKVAVITGGNSGIGLATARAFVNEGAHVVLFGRNRETLDAAVAELGERALGVQGDVASFADLDRLARVTGERFGRIDVLFVNAGIAPFVPFAQMSEDAFDQVFDINVKGAYFTVQKLLPLLGEGSSVIFTTSVVNQKGMPTASAYSATKAAVRSLARTLAAELVERGIRVNAVSPGPIETPIFGRMGLSADAMAELGQELRSKVPLKRMGRDTEVANAVMFLASPESSFVLGSEIAVDGGLGQV